MSEPSTIRLSKVLKEFSIGIDHALDFLDKKGIKVEKNPNAKITVDAYELLQNEFQSDKQIKKSAEEITNQKFRKDNVVIEARPASETVREKEVDTEDTLARDLIQIKQDAAEKDKPKVTSRKPKAEPKEEPEVIKAKIDKTSPVIVDKIDLEALKPAKKKSAKKAPEKTEEEKPATKTAAKKRKR